ncbi:MAG: aldehyde ferredoxin oxidoreductase family protein [Oscillospiraceae bacterium]|nr:aldehyde ferredoxin oxidoreductase family protein [Oscillospiraceae bacterium]
MHAYTGKILYVNLTTGEHTTGGFDEEFAKAYIGGTGFGIKTLIDNLAPGTDALAPENPLIYAVGATSGTLVPCTASKFGVFAKSPATGLLGEAYSTGQFGAELRMAGYDIIVITGRAAKPVYLWIDDASVQIMDASDLWGMSTWEAEQAIRDELGDQNVRVSGIGKAGEKLVRLACLINDHFRAAGRTGLGAVMGSKNLKAVAVRGTKDVRVAQPEALQEFCKDLFERAKGPATAKYRTLGTPANILTMNAQGCLPTRNYQDASFEGADKISGERVNEKHVTKIQGCSACPCRCEHIAEVKEGPFKGAVARIEYEPMMAFGSYCGVDDLEAVIKSLEYCDVYGVDAIGTGIVVGFAMECFERGLITKEDTGGLELVFGNGHAMVEMVRKIACREDIGDLFAEGVKRAAEKIGRGSEHFAMHIKGLEMTGYDVRGLKTCALGYAVSRRGADHQRHGSYSWDLTGKTDRFTADAGRGKFVMDDEDLYAVIDSMIICKFTRSIWKVYDDIAKVYTQVTGIPMTAGEMGKTGHRINTLARIFNIREGLTRADDNLPPRVMKDPIPSGVAAGSLVTQEELDIMLDGYYEARGWSKSGVPTAATLAELGLSAYEGICGTDDPSPTTCCMHTSSE